MKYNYNESIETNKQWKDSKGQAWGYTTKKVSNYVADVSKKGHVNSNDLLFLEERQVVVEPCKKKLGLFEKVAGYIPCTNENNELVYIRIVVAAPVRVLVMLLCLCCLLGGGLCYFKNTLKPSDDTPIKIKTGQLTNPNPNNIRLPGIEKIYMEANQKHVNQPLLNVEGNAYNLKYTIVLAQTGEVLYTSKVIKPGYGVKQFDMNRTFKKGQYPITITVSSSAQQDRKKKDKDKKLAYNAGKLNAVLVVQ